MRVRFENWYKNQSMPQEATNLFNESIMCYKVSAYRASLLMAYLGFQNVLKYRLLHAPKKPDEFDEGFWNTTLRKLNDDKEWDEVVFDMVNRTRPCNPFLINDDIRKQFEYWRTIRNDCAHAKGNIISYPHVESYWLFIESNFNRFAVNGGKEGLLDRIKRHYDKRFTPPNSDIEPIVDDILNSMDIAEIPNFLDEVHKYLDGEFWLINVFEKDTETYNFWSSIAKHSNSILREGLIKFVKSDWGIFIKFISEFPEKLVDISSDNQFMREFWTEEIWKLSSYGYFNDWEIVRILIANRIIPNNEINDFMKNLAKRFNSNPPEDMIDILKGEGYFKELKAILFDKKAISSPPGGIEFANRNWNRIKFYITQIELDDIVVKELNNGHLASHYGTFHEGINKLFEENDSFKNEYKEIVVRNNLTIPDCLK